MTSCYHIMERSVCFVEFASWRHREQSHPSPTASCYFFVASATDHHRRCAVRMELRPVEQVPPRRAERIFAGDLRLHNDPCVRHSFTHARAVLDVEVSWHELCARRTAFRCYEFVIFRRSAPRHIPSATDQGPYRRSAEVVRQIAAVNYFDAGRLTTCELQVV